MRQAETAYRQALLLEDDPDAHYSLARLLLSSARHDAALRHIEAARQTLPDAPDLLQVGAPAHLAAGSREGARDLLHRFLALSKTSNLWPKRVEWDLAHTLLVDLESESGLAHWERAWAIHPRIAAVASMLRGDLSVRVVAVFHTEAEERPRVWYAQANYGMALLQSSRANEAVRFLRRAAKLAPEKQGIAFHLARALAGAGRRAESLEILEGLLKDLPQSALRSQVQILYDRMLINGGRLFPRQR